MGRSWRLRRAGRGACQGVIAAGPWPCGAPRVRLAANGLSGGIMAGSVNKVILVGNLGRDPEVRHTQDGTKIVHLSVATSERWRDRGSGENRERTEWHRVVIFNERLGEIAEKYLPRGAPCISRASCRHANGPTSGPGEVHDRGRAAAFSRRAHLARRPGRRRRLWRWEPPDYGESRSSGPGGGSGVAVAEAAAGKDRRLRRPGRRDPVLSALTGPWPEPWPSCRAVRPCG